MFKDSNKLMVKGNVIGIKFINGDEVICMVEGVANGCVTLLRPYTITPSVNEEGDPAVAFAPWPWMVDDDEQHRIVMALDKILVAFHPRGDFIEETAPLYKGLDKPAIVVPDKKIIT